MYDWNDEEFAHITWGEAAESDDHIVPYRGPSDHYCPNKEWKQQSDTIKLTEQTAPRDKIESDSKRLESSATFDSGQGIPTSTFGTNSWADSSISNVAKNEQHLIGEAIQLDKYGEFFENSNEDKEQGNLDDYGWASIGSFYDLDRIFSEDDTMFANACLGSGEELWSSSRDGTKSSNKAFPVSSDSPSLTSGVLKTASEHLETKTDYAQKNSPSITPGYANTDYPASRGLQSVHAILDHVEYAGYNRQPMTKEQVSRQRKIPRCGNKFEEKTEEKSVQDWPSQRNPFGQFENRLEYFVAQTSPSSALSQKGQLQGPESFPYQLISNQYVAQPMYGNLTNPNPAMHVSSHAQSEEFKHQRLFSGYEVSPGDANTMNKSADTSPKCLTMTPQEKIEKLRKRQQLQAVLAIQKQQQQFDHQISSTSQSSTKCCPQENQIHHLERADQEVDGLTTLPSLDPNSSLQQDDSSMVSAAANDSAEDTVLYRLQEIISKLDIEVRHCIRDSLFRLSRSTVQRHNSGETSSSNKSNKDEHEVVTKEETNSHSRMPDVETETNPIDRTMAQLLFHRPMDSLGKHSGAPESPLSTKLPHKRKTEGLLNLSNEYLPDSLKNEQCFPLQGSTDYCPLAKPRSANQFKTSSYSENASNNVPADG